MRKFKRQRLRTHEVDCTNVKLSCMTSDARSLTNAISESQGTRRLNTSADILYLGLLVPGELQLLVKLVEVAPGQDLERRHDPLASKLLDGLDRPSFRDLYLERAFSEAQTEDLRDVVLHLGFEDDIVSGDAEVDAAEADEGGYVGGRKEDAVVFAVSGDLMDLYGVYKIE